MTGWNLPKLNAMHNPEYKLCVKVNKPSDITLYNILIMSMKQIMGITYCMSLLHEQVGLAMLVVLPILIGALSNFDSIQAHLASHHYSNVINLHQLAGHVIKHGENETNTEFVKCSESVAAQLAETTPSWWRRIQIISSWMSWGLLYFLGYCFMFVCIWPMLLLTPFIFGIALMCEVDPGIEMEWHYLRLCRYWTWFMAAKVWRYS